MDDSPGRPESSDYSRRELLATAVTAGALIAIVPALPGCSSNKAAQGQNANLPEGATVPVTLTINGRAHTLQLEPRVTLLDVLRENLQLYGTKKGCDHGQCGACTVLVNDRRVNSCLMLAIAAQGKQITTVEVLPTATNCTRCRRRSSSTMVSSVATARRARSARPSR
jgi:xanthine dehydrogenase YagT iron-sulfur-binding subunit